MEKYVNFLMIFIAKDWKKKYNERNVVCQVFNIVFVGEYSFCHRKFSGEKTDAHFAIKLRIALSEQDWKRGIRITTKSRRRHWQ